jgi:hypothetical protein
MLTAKRCGRCGTQVSLWSRAGQQCPHCGAHWSYEKTLWEKVFSRERWQIWNDLREFTPRNILPLLGVLVSLSFVVAVTGVMIGAPFYAFNYWRPNSVVNGEGPFVDSTDQTHWSVVSGRRLFIRAWFGGMSVVALCLFVPMGIFNAGPFALDGAPAGCRPIGIVFLCVGALLLWLLMPAPRPSHWELSRAGFSTPTRTIPWHEIQTVTFRGGRPHHANDGEPLLIEVALSNRTTESFDAPPVMHFRNHRAGKDDPNLKVWMASLGKFAPRVTLVSADLNREPKVLYPPASK